MMMTAKKTTRKPTLKQQLVVDAILAGNGNVEDITNWIVNQPVCPAIYLERGAPVTRWACRQLMTRGWLFIYDDDSVRIAVAVA